MFCSSQVNQYVPCGPCLWVMITGHRVASEKFPTSCLERGRIENRTSGNHRKVAHERDEKLLARNWSGGCAQAHTNCPWGHGSGQLHAKFMRGTSFQFTQGGNKEARKTLKDSSAKQSAPSHNKWKHVALKILLRVNGLHSCYWPLTPETSCNSSWTHIS